MADNIINVVTEQQEKLATEITMETDSNDEEAIPGTPPPPSRKRRRETSPIKEIPKRAFGVNTNTVPPATSDGLCESLLLSSLDEEQIEESVLKQNHALDFTYLNDHQIGQTTIRSRFLPFSVSKSYEFYISPRELTVRSPNWIGKIFHSFQSSIQDVYWQHRTITSKKYDVSELVALATEVMPTEHKLLLSSSTTVAATTTQYTPEQTAAYKTIRSAFDKKRFSTILLSGPAGTGKTVCLSQLVHSPATFWYITTQNNLLEDAKEKLHLGAHNALTLAQLLMRVFKINFYVHCELNKKVIGATLDVIQSSQMSDLMKHTAGPIKDMFYDVSSNDNDDDGEYYDMVICIDEFSMISANIIALLQCVLNQFCERFQRYRIVLLLSGDYYQIQPLFVTKVAPISYSPTTTITDNIKQIIALTDEQIMFSTQMRNDDAQYQHFLQNFIRIDRWQYELFMCFHNVCSVREIPYYYPVDKLITLPIVDDFENPSTEYIKSIFHWSRETRRAFNTFSFFSYTNVEAHTMNLNLAYSIRLQYDAYFQDRDDKIQFDFLAPVMAKIKFLNSLRYWDVTLFEGPIQTCRLALLPLIYGMKYKILHSQPQGLKRGQIVQLVHVQYDENKKVIVGVLGMDSRGNLYRIRPCYFKMNLFCARQDYFQYVNDENETVEAPPNSVKLLFGLPLQLNVSDTIRGSIGITIENDIYANLNGCSVEDIYVLLSRTRNKMHIKGLSIGV